MHFIQVRSPEPDALALICTHGWPMSVFEYLDLIGPLSDPRAHDGDPADAFHLVIPSVPGVAFSGPTTGPGWDTPRIARAWVGLMARLGYERYGAHGNDAGSLISPEVGRHDPERVVGVHVTQLFQRWLAPDDILTHASAYWLTGTIGSSIRRYYEETHAGRQPTEPTTTPTGVAIFAEDFQSVRRFAERDHANITSWHRYERGSHFAPQDAPDLLLDDLRGFFRQLR